MNCRSTMSSFHSLVPFLCDREEVIGLRFARLQDGVDALTWHVTAIVEHGLLTADRRTGHDGDLGDDIE